jgi:hypothetical protein
MFSMLEEFELPAEISGHLFLHSMPGLYEYFDKFPAEARRTGISTVATLASLQEIRDSSPDYHRADVRCMLPRDACLECWGGFRWQQDAEYELNRRPSELRRSGPASWRDERAGSLITLNSVAVGAALQLYLDSAAERSSGSR